MKFLSHLCVAFAVLASASARADCPLAFAPPEVRRAASEHYYRSSKRDAPAPGHLPVAVRSNESTCALEAVGDDPAIRCIQPARDAVLPEAAQGSSDD